VEVDAVCPDLAQLLTMRFGSIGPNGVAERVAANVADGPEAEREVVLGAGV
jgi:hypothetical protein